MKKANILFHTKYHINQTTGLLTVSNVITRIVSLIFFILLARALTVEDYGSFRYLIQISMLYAIFFTGIPTAIAKFIGEKKG